MSKQNIDTLRDKTDAEPSNAQRMLEALNDVMNNHVEVEAVRKAFDDFVIGQRGRARYANSARIAYEKELTDEIERLRPIEARLKMTLDWSRYPFVDTPEKAKEQTDLLRFILTGELDEGSKLRAKSE